MNNIKTTILIILFPILSYSQVTVMPKIIAGLNIMSHQPKDFRFGANSGVGFTVDIPSRGESKFSTYFGGRFTYNSVSVAGEKRQFNHNRLVLGFNNDWLFVGAQGGFLYNLQSNIEADVRNVFSGSVEVVTCFPFSGNFVAGVRGEIGSFDKSPFVNLDGLSKVFASGSLFIARRFVIVN